MANPFDQFDEPKAAPQAEANPFDQFDRPAQREPTATEQFLAKAPLVGTMTAPEAAGAAETGLTIGSSMIAEPLAGLAGLAQTINPFAEPEAGRRAVEATREALTYQPRTPMGRAKMEEVGQLMQPIGEAVGAVETAAGDVGYERGVSGMMAPPLNIAIEALDAAGFDGAKEVRDVDRALGGALSKAAPTAILELLGLKGTTSLRGARRITGISDKTADAIQRAGLDIDDLSDANIQKIKRVAGEEAKDQIERLKSFEAERVQPTRGDIGQDFEQQKIESFLAEQTGEAGEQMRGLRLSQSRKLRENLESMVNDIGVPEEVGASVKDALFGRKSDLKTTRRAAYDSLAESTKDMNVPVSTQAVADALPDAGDFRDFAATNPNQSNAVNSLLKEFGVIASGEIIEPLSVANFERFRKRLNNIAKSDISGETQRVVAPIKKALDDEIDVVTKSLIQKGAPEVSELAKDARNAHIALKTEFDPKALTDRLVASKARGSNTPKFEESQVYQQLSSKSTPVEQFDNVVKSLGETAQGKKAIADIKNRMLLDIIDSAYGGGSRKIGGERTFGSKAFQNKFSDLKPKLEKVFSPAEMKRLDNMNKIAESIQVPSGAVPKGSAGLFVETLNKLGMSAIMNKLPGGQLFVEKLMEASRASKNKVDFRKALEKPEIKNAVEVVRNDYPSLAVALGISEITDEEER